MNIVLSGPSGTGKGTLTEMLLKNSGFKKFTTCTTRKPRDGEKNGFDYYFLDEEKFLKLVESGEMFNVRKYGGNYYGSFERDIDHIISSKDIIFQLTPDRAIQMKEKNPNTLLILILPPSVEDLNFRRKDRSLEKIKNDIQNIKDAIGYDCVIVNDDLNVAYNELLKCIETFKNNSLIKSKEKTKKVITEFLLDFSKALSQHSCVEKVFNAEVAKKWDNKAEFVVYHGIKNPIKSEIMASIFDGMTIVDIGCGAGKIIQRIDSKVDGCNIKGLDISPDMIQVAENKIFTGNNEISFINNDFMQYDFKSKYDLLIFSYVLHHLDNPVEALKKARNMLTSTGQTIFSVPGTDYLKEVFVGKELEGRFSVSDMDSMVDEAGLYPISAKRNKFLMEFNSYELFLKYLKSIGTYQKINGYTNEPWTDKFNEEILRRFIQNQYITGEYLTYTCEDKVNMLRKK